MASNRFAARRAQRVKITDENANAQGPVFTKLKGSLLPPGGAQRVPIATKAVPIQTGNQRAALGEVALNLRKDSTTSGKISQPGPTKRARSSSLLAAAGSQRISQPPNAPLLANRPASRIARASVPSNRPTFLRSDGTASAILKDNADIDMNVEEDAAINGAPGMEILSEDEETQKTEVEEMVGIEGSTVDLVSTSPVSRATTPPSSAVAEKTWPAPPSPNTRAQIIQIKEEFVELEPYDQDPTMVSEYANEIFEYMGKLEDECMPGENYIDGQGEITWEMRQTLVDWLLQVHTRYRLLPETLWIAVNIVDRFLTKRIVSLVKLQLVGVTSMFIATKYEEIMAPSVDEFVFMTENGYSRDEILKGERIILQTLDFRISNYCSPYSWIRRISKADDYDLQTRTLSKFLMEVTLLDYHFLGVKPSMIAAIGMYSARTMLGTDWNEAFIYYSGFTEAQLQPGHDLLVDKLCSPNFETQAVYKKYLHKKFLKASSFAREWALHATAGDDMNAAAVA